MKKIIFVFFILCTLNIYSQGLLTVQNIKMEFSGFVRNDFIFDSRRNVDACDHLFEIFPDKPVYDENGKDINAQPSTQFLNTFTRFGTRFSGLEMAKATVSAYVEVDFTGGEATNSLRLRHVYTQFAWEKSKLLFGRTWHPIFIEKVYPGTLNENTGVPFQVFNRSPQLRFTGQLSKNLDFIAGAVYQFKYANTGPAGKDYHYQRDALVPNLNVQLQYYNEHWVLGAALDWKSIQPRTSTTGTDGTFRTREKLNTMAALAYLKYTDKKFQFKAKSMYGQNVCENLLPSGYAVASVDSRTGAETYTPFNHIYNWIDISYGGDWNVGLYVGQLKNLGTSENPVNLNEYLAHVENSGITDANLGPLYGFAYNTDMMYRISPRLIYNYRNFMFGFELSLTTVAYGVNDYNDKAKVKTNKELFGGNSMTATNFRNMIAIAYKF